MAEEASNKKVISKKNSDFPKILDFNQLRTDSITYLSELAGRVWTDYNVHDPGITILEALIYAIIDLGYRTNLPKENILAPPSPNSGEDDNFFTPAQIFANNPLTITDYRKLLIDIEGVRNAWLVTANDLTVDAICDRREAAKQDVAGLRVKQEQECCIDYLNGLYHVYLDVENPYPDGSKEHETYSECVLNKVKKALMSHRNLCEDFIDIHILCRLKLGVCAKIELQPDADAEKSYILIAEALHDLFSPSPRFYTLQQLLDKKIPIEEIFAGRPSNIGESHGFVDTNEFEAIRLKKEIHLSDVYSALLAVKGVKAVSHLVLSRCENTGKPADIPGWVFPLPQNTIPDFKMDCSSFQFTRNNITVPIDFKKFEPYFSFNFSNDGKRLYPAQSPYLDAAIKYGNYPADLGTYLSVQNEFPLVYGIGKGQLSADAKPERRANALQLKGYLLFFDQLLANYLAQLKNIRNLFAFSNPLPENKHSYFLNELNTVPELNRLLRFSAHDNEDFNVSIGSSVAFPVDSKLLQEKIDAGNTSKSDIISDLTPFTFQTIAECETSMYLLRSDLANADFRPRAIQAPCDRYYFYFNTSSDKIAILSKKTYSDEKKALTAGFFVQSVASFSENYRRYSVACTDQFSFEIENNFFGYLSNLQQIIETENEFHQRRNIFLNHLLSRFAERFTDYALLSYKLNATDLLVTSIRAKEEFLVRYPELSSNRGKGYDYSLDGWNNEAVSGFEKKFYALAGIENWNRRSHCNFIVEAEDEEFALSVPYYRDRVLTSVANFERESALQSIASLFNALSAGTIFEVAEIPATGTYEIFTHDQNQNRYHDGNFSSQKIAEDFAEYLNGLFKFKTDEKDIRESSFYYYVHLVRKGDDMAVPLRSHQTRHTRESEVMDIIGKSFREINDEEKWKILQPLDKETGKSHLIPDLQKPDEYLDASAFKIDINDNIEGKPGLFDYEVLDRKYHKFKLRSVNEFPTRKKAENDAHRLLFLLNDRRHYSVVRDEDSDKPLIRVLHHETVIARSEVFKSEERAYEKINEICDIADRHRYVLIYSREPYRWRFRYQLTAPGRYYFFESKKEFSSKEAALVQSRTFATALPSMTYDEKKRQLSSDEVSGGASIPVAILVTEKNIAEEQTRDFEKNINEALGFKKLFYSNTVNTNPEMLEGYLRKTGSSINGDYVYRLVDKDNILAVYRGSDFDFDCNDTKKNRTAFKLISERSLWWLEISQGNDIITEEKDIKTGFSWFHYQLRCLNRFTTDGKELVIFQSVHGYRDPEDARKAFKEEYLDIMQLALNHSSYGKYISLTKLLVHEDVSFSTTETKVFVPKLTLDEMGHYDEEATRKIISLVHGFPIRSTTTDTKKFKDLFKCHHYRDEEKNDREDCKSAPVNDNCHKKDEKEAPIVYFFVVESWSDSILKQEWQGLQWYTAAEEAFRQFKFFVSLCSNRINYAASSDNCDCSCRIYIREVLAQSAGRFPDPAAAWGRNGVQRFICISQADHSFQTFFNRNNCCNSFYVTGNSFPAYHPCTYDSPEKRDHALANMISASNTMVQYKLPWIFLADDLVTILDINKNPIAELIEPSDHQKDFCRQLFYLWHLMIKKCNYGQKDDAVGGKPYLTNDEEVIVAVSVDPVSLDVFRSKMQESAYFFPLMENKGKGSTLTYCVEIRFPQGWSQSPKKKQLKECGCENFPERPDDFHCDIAWKSTCCFNNCQSAFENYLEIIKILEETANYRAVFDCKCNSYGIQLLQENDIVAYNPQCYADAEKACAAVKRANMLINSEGLHVVEHILLRPHCKEECECMILKDDPCNYTSCEKFRWSPGESTDPCEEMQDVCFIPGADPYSFIATVALPAWPKRFRDKESRNLVERMLYQEAPAHVMLRILWLAPHDFCCFETHYKKWGRYLAGKIGCDKNYNICSFLNFLFRQSHECLQPCPVPACENTSRETQPCLNKADKEDQCHPFPFLDQINTYFCWTSTDCCDYKFIECNESTRKIETDPRWMESKERRDLINNRNAKYRFAVNEIISATKESDNPLLLRAQSFLRKTAPGFAQLKDLVEEALQNKVAKGRKLNKNKIQVIIRNAILYYLDRIAFDGNISEQGEVFGAFLKQHEKKLDPARIYEDWNETEALRIQPDMDIRAVRELMK